MMQLSVCPSTLEPHLKNFSLVERNGEYRLSPAYDLINTSLQIWEPRLFALEKGLFKEGMALSDTRNIRRQDFVEFGMRIGLPSKIVTKEIDCFSAEQPMVKELLGRSLLSDDLKRQYFMGYDFRRKMLSF